MIIVFLVILFRALVSITLYFRIMLFYSIDLIDDASEGIFDISFLSFASFGSKCVAERTIGFTNLSSFANVTSILSSSSNTFLTEGGQFYKSSFRSFRPDLLFI